MPLYWSSFKKTEGTKTTIVLNRFWMTLIQYKIVLKKILAVKGQISNILKYYILIDSDTIYCIFIVVKARFDKNLYANSSYVSLHSTAIPNIIFRSS